MESEEEKSTNLSEEKCDNGFPGESRSREAIREETHRVNVTITVAVAYQKPNDEHSKFMDELIRRNKKTVEAPRPHQYLHCEYTVAPKYEKVLTDVVTYSVAAKVFTENDARVVKTWDDGNLIWVAWMHSHELEVTSKNVLQLYNHTIDMKIWDAKEKVSIKARTDRPKAFRLPSATEVSFPGKGVQAAVLKQSSSWLNMQPRDSVTDMKKRSVKRSSIPPLNQMDIAGQEKAREKKDDQTQAAPLRVRSSLGRLAGINASDEEKKRINELKRQQAHLQKQISKSSKANFSASSDKRKGRETKEKEGSVINSKKGKSTNVEGQLQKFQSARHKPVKISVKLGALFSGLKTYTKRLHEPSGSILDALVTISVDGPLLPDNIQHNLNPMVITIKSVKDLPPTPVPYNRLSIMCDPVYCKYLFLGHQVHATNGRPHGRHVYFEDNHVVLLGRLNDGEVREFIQSNSLAVEIHDRDGKEDETPGVPSIFGDEANDEKISNVGVISAKRTTQNAFQSKKKAYDPYGIARVNLIELLKGQTKLNLEIPVNPSPIPNILCDPMNTHRDVELVGLPGAVDRPERPPFLPGHYIQTGTVLKVKISLLYPLVPHENVPRLLPLPSQICPFNRVIFCFDFKNKELLKWLEQYVTDANATALKLSHLDKSIIANTLSTYKLTIDQKKNRKLDIITGFHVIDDNIHLVVLEGLGQGAMLGLHHELDRSILKDGEKLLHLFDTSLTFSARLYAGLDVDLCRIRLHQTIGEIMKQPLLYVRDMVPRPCFECLTKIKQICELTRLRHVVQSKLFPSSDMIISMSREFGVPLTYDDFETHHNNTEIEDDEEKNDDILMQQHPGRRWTPIDNNNQVFMQAMKKRIIQPSQQDYVVTNIVAVQEAGKRQRPRHPKVHDLITDAPAHNYSTQTLNTSELAKDMLRNMLKEQDPKARFAYHPTNNSAMVVPVDVTAYYRSQEKIDRQKWQTKAGFVYPGVKSSQACNEHVFKPDDSRINDLRLQFKDNSLHRNILEPTLSRDRMKWDDRMYDIELYKMPNIYFGESPPVTIHLAGQLLAQEKLAQKMLEAKRWKEGLIVDDPQMRFHRVLPQTEKTNASNQLDKLTNLLKDEPKKFALKRQPVPLIPPLSVVLNPSVDTAARSKNVKLPPAFDESREKNVGFMPGPHDNITWNMEKNKIKIQDPCHEKFAKIHGHDMNLVHTDRTLLSKHKIIKDLSHQEKETHYFKISHIDRKVSKKDKPIAPEYEDWTDYGKGMEERSEYRHKYSEYDIIDHVKKIYPKHTFHGWTPMMQDGKPMKCDASIMFVNEDSSKTKQISHIEDKVKVGFTLPGEASIKISDTKPLAEMSG